ncbi:MAG TPA: ABC transporter ATP-binding protein [Gemmatimonadaceae bacterium]|nr:ABC transporter ATP-binding protein [Gemmatimonadaceae bacterium]
MIEFSDVRVRYPRQQREALQGVSLSAPRAQITAVVGPNGSGKSTLVRTLLRRVDVAAGAITLDGVSITESSREAVARRVAIVTQREESAFPISVRDYVALGRLPHRGAWGRDTAQDRQAVDDALRWAEADSLRDRSVHQLSGGEWQRARFARALAQGGEAFVADEPTTFLDVAHEMTVFELLGRLARDGRAVLLVSHQLNLVARFADRLVLLHEGRVAAAGLVADVMRAEILERVYQWPVVVTRDPAVGAPALIPLRRGRGRGTTSD